MITTKTACCTRVFRDVLSSLLSLYFVILYYCAVLYCIAFGVWIGTERYLFVFVRAGDDEQVLEAEPACVVPNAEAFCHRGSSRLGQGKALEALDDCYRALSLLSLEVGEAGGNGFRREIGAEGRVNLYQGHDMYPRQKSYKWGYPQMEKRHRCIYICMVITHTARMDQPDMV